MHPHWSDSNVVKIICRPLYITNTRSLTLLSGNDHDGDPRRGVIFPTVPELFLLERRIFLLAGRDLSGPPDGTRSGQVGNKTCQEGASALEYGFDGR